MSFIVVHASRYVVLLNWNHKQNKCIKMRSLLVVLLFVALSYAETVLYPRGCIYIMGRCYKECPVNTHAYALGCGYKTPEATCREPNPVPETAMLCDYSACYCDAPTVRDEKTDQCVLLKDCSPQKTDPKEVVDPKPCSD